MVKEKGVHCPNCWKTNNGVEIFNDGANTVIIDCINCQQIMTFKLISKISYNGDEVVIGHTSKEEAPK